jgi:hypothetical protein
MYRMFFNVDLNVAEWGGGGRGKNICCAVGDASCGMTLSSELKLGPQDLVLEHGQRIQFPCGQYNFVQICRMCEQVLCLAAHFV